MNTLPSMDRHIQQTNDRLQCIKQSKLSGRVGGKGCTRRSCGFRSRQTTPAVLVLILSRWRLIRLPSSSNNARLYRSSRTDSSPPSHSTRASLSFSHSPCFSSPSVKPLLSSLQTLGRKDSTVSGLSEQARETDRD
ncbi:hypothetical protein PAMP_001605 [Pampus punctatissimus]